MSAAQLLKLAILIQQQEKASADQFFFFGLYDDAKPALICNSATHSSGILTKDYVLSLSVSLSSGHIPPFSE